MTAFFCVILSYPRKRVSYIIPHKIPSFEGRTFLCFTYGLARHLPIRGISLRDEPSFLLFILTAKSIVGSRVYMMHAIMCRNNYADNIQDVYHASRGSNFPLQYTSKKVTINVFIE